MSNPAEKKHYGVILNHPFTKDGRNTISVWAKDEEDAIIYAQAIISFKPDEIDKVILL